ncbi:MAG: hypothetical protein M3014_05310 [Chloroflexota bacterium]|nr:hypothetical protein [Chloroflexota bacterium]
MKKPFRLSFFWIIVLLWALLVVAITPPITDVWNRYGPNAHWDNGPALLFTVGFVVLYCLRYVLKGIWDWLGRDGTENRQE